MLDGGVVRVREDEVFDVRVLWPQQLGEIQLFLLAEVIEHRLAVGCGGIERAHERLGGAVVILHVVREHHELGDVDEAPELGVLEPLDDAVALIKDAVAVVGLFDLDEDERETIDGQGDVRAELLVVFLAGELGDDVVGVPVQVLEVDDLQPGGGGDLLVELLAEVFIVQGEVELTEGVVDFYRRGRGIDGGDALAEEGGDDVAGLLILQCLEGQVSVTQPREVEDRGDFDPGVFVELHGVERPGP